MSTNFPSSEAQLPFSVQSAPLAPPVAQNLTAPSATEAFAPTFLAPAKRPSPTRFGFTIAAIFVATGGLLLMLVFIMSLGLSSPHISVASQVSLPPHMSVTSDLATPTYMTAPATTPVSQYPGQTYIDNIQMASSVNTMTAIPIQVTTNFKVKQRAFVTFSLHPGQSGAVCLFWYMNDKSFTHYAFAVDGTSTPAWSYASVPEAGPGYVEIYWASNTTCADKLLAQRADFLVTA